MLLVPTWLITQIDSPVAELEPCTTSSLVMVRDCQFQSRTRSSCPRTNLQRTLNQLPRLRVRRSDQILALISQQVITIFCTTSASSFHLCLIPLLQFCGQYRRTCDIDTPFTMP